MWDSLRLAPIISMLTIASKEKNFVNQTSRIESSKCHLISADKKWLMSLSTDKGKVDSVIVIEEGRRFTSFLQHM